MVVWMDGDALSDEAVSSLEVKLLGGLGAPIRRPYTYSRRPYLFLGYLTVSLYPTCKELGRVLRSTNKPTTHPSFYPTLTAFIDIATEPSNLLPYIALSPCLHRLETRPSSTLYRPRLISFYLLFTVYLSLLDDLIFTS